jgi:hypothetical protein
MLARNPLPAHRQTLTQCYALRALVLDRLAGPLAPATRRMERDHLDRLEQLICDAEGRIGHLEARAERLL